MSQHDYDITKGDANTGISVRAEINSALQALASNNSGSGDPAVTYGYQFKFNTGESPVGFYVRKGDNSSWVKAGYVNATGQLKLLDADAATNATNADTVDNIHASATAEANKLVALDSNLKLPSGVIIPLARMLNTGAGTNGEAQASTTTADYVDIVLDGVAAGDRIQVSSNAYHLYNGAPATSYCVITKNAGTAVIDWAGNTAGLQVDDQVSNTWHNYAISGVARVTTGGTLTIRMYIPSNNNSRALYLHGMVWRGA